MMSRRKTREEMIETLEAQLARGCGAIARACRYYGDTEKIDEREQVLRGQIARLRESPEPLVQILDSMLAPRGNHKS